MTKLEDVEELVTTTTPTTTTTKGSNSGNDGNDQVSVPGEDTPISDTVAAATVAVLAVVLILTLLIIFRALRKRRRARQGQRMDDIPTISAGIMGAGVSAYNNIPIAGRVTWEPVAESSTSASSPNLHRGENSSPSRADRHNRRGRHPRRSNSQQTSS